jgi:hypothetical protein
MANSKLSIKHTAVVTGRGQMVAGEIAEALRQLPKDATFKVETRSDQRDGDSWTIYAEWDGVAQSNWHQPVYRSPSGSGRPDA